jgi:endonuclease/exonuclease/phosphatase family metal-dependent hydrolase
MSSSRYPESPVRQVLGGFFSLPPLALAIVTAGLLFCALAFVAITGLGTHPGRPAPQQPTGPVAQPPATPSAQPPSDAYLFCFWNLENLFDDRPEERPQRADEGYDDWFAGDPAALDRKLANLSAVLLSMNDRRGPDVLAAAELESPRAAELLRDRLNQGLPAGVPPYDTVLMKEPSGGRHIGPAILTRLRADRSRTRLLHKPFRILEGHIDVNGHDLVVITSHWSSRVSDKDGHSRDRYADVIYGRFREMYHRHPAVDLLVAGDFNDTPDEPSVREHLHAIGLNDEEKEQVRAGGAEPWLLNLFPSADGEVGSYFYRGRWFQFDQVVVSPGMLDTEGWSVVADTARVHTTAPVPHYTIGAAEHPNAFDSRNDRRSLDQRGYSDHFPVTVRLRVAAPQ